MSLINLKIVVLLIIGGYCSVAFGQTGNGSKTIIDKFSTFSTAHPSEKAYLQFDKPYYAAGDTIYFKAYLIRGGAHRLSDMSGVLHVDLINTKNKIDQSIKLQLDSGIAWGDFALPDSLPTGQYRVRAYTRWMRNDGDIDFFDCNISVGSLKPGKIPETGGVKLAHVVLKPDIQFFPEGGVLLTGVRSKVAFKAVGINGTGINAKGIIVDEQGQQVAIFQSAHLGMGYFYLTPVEGKAYTAKINYPNGREDAIQLPAQVASGIVLAVNSDSVAKTTVSIQANETYFQNNKNKAYTLLVNSGGLITAVNCRLDSSLIKLDLLKRKLHTGVTRITLFSAANEPLSERLIFVQNYDHLNLNIKSNKSTYTRREKVNIQLGAINRRGDAAEGHFSASVTAEDQVPEAGEYSSNILSYLLLSSELKGEIEQPAYYFTEDPIAANNLDVLMMTQGYRHFAWTQVLAAVDKPLAYQPELGIDISGQVRNLFNNPVKNGSVTLISSHKGGILISPTNEDGMFSFQNLIFTDTAHFVLSAVNANNKNSTKIAFFGGGWDEPQVTPATRLYMHSGVDTAMRVYLDKDKMQLELVRDIYRKSIKLKEVEVRDMRPKDLYFTQSLAGAGHADQVLQADEIERVPGSLVASLQGRLQGVTFNRGNPYLVGIGYMFVVVDGVEGTRLPDYNLQSSDVQTVEVLKSATGLIYGGAGGYGVLVITTKQGGGRRGRDVVSIGVLPIAPMGFYKAREFYSPKYDHPDVAAKQRDLRSTVYWQPELKTDKNGNATFEYYNADGRGTYKIIIEGIDKDGNIGRQEYTYKVE